jgi:threonine aldolase
MAPSGIEMKPQCSAPQLQQEENESSFRYTQTTKLKIALEKAGRDFRSDVVTVPTERMMQVRLDLMNHFQKLKLTTQSTGHHRCYRGR